jgi:pilus assembly protein CpaE
MITNFSIYYKSPENKDYLQKIIEASGTGKLVEAKELANLPAQAAGKTDLVLLEYRENDPELDHWIETTAANPQAPPIFLYFQEISTNKLWKALRLGAKECFTFPIEEKDFQQAVKRIQAQIGAKKELAKPTQTISFLGCKGGVGTTLLLANLATLLAQEGQGKVLLVDLDLGFGQLNYFFDIHPQHTMTDVVGNLDRLDSKYLQSVLYPLGDNLYLLPAPARLEESEVINAGHLEKIVRYVKEQMGFRWVLIDCCHTFDEITLKALELSDILMLVGAQSIPALSNAKKMLDILTLLDLKALDVKVLVNFWDRQHELTQADVEGFLGRAVAGTITCDYKQAAFSVNEGKPLVGVAPRHAITGDLKLIAEMVCQDNAPEETNGSKWTWLQSLWRKKKS